MTASPPALDSRTHALFLDFDGTLVPFAETPDGIEVGWDLKELIDQLHQRFQPAFAFVTGRAVDNLIRHVDRDDLTVAGAHGAEWRHRGRTERLGTSDAFPEAIETVRELVQDDPRLVMEIKSGGLTVHYRRAAEREKEVSKLVENAFADLPAFTIMPGHMMVEARRIDADKGRAIENLMTLHDFAGRSPVFIGDDVTDEFGFAAVNRMGGLSIRVGAGNTQASFRLDSIEAVHAYLLSSLGR